jgi:hypothetical protein
MLKLDMGPPKLKLEDELTPALIHLEQQTGLDLNKEPRTVDVWEITEEK